MLTSGVSCKQERSTKNWGHIPEQAKLALVYNINQRVLKQVRPKMRTYNISKNHNI